MLVEIASWNLEEASIDIAAALLKNKPGLTRKEYSHLLGCSERTLYRWTQQGRLFSNLFISRGTHEAIKKLEEQGYKVIKV